jgi:hypothetical protein
MVVVVVVFVAKGCCCYDREAGKDLLERGVSDRWRERESRGDCCPKFAWFKKQHGGAQLAPWDSLWRKSGVNLLSGTAQIISPS